MNPNMTDLFDKYLHHQMNEEEKKAFEETLNSNDIIKKAFDEYQSLMNAFKDYHQKNELEQKMNEWYLEEMTSISDHHKKNWWRVAYIAASVALIVTLTGLWFYDTLKKETKKQDKEITYLKKELSNIQKQQHHIVQNIEKIKTQQHPPANSQSTGFLIASNYLLTTYHSVQNADSVFVENEYLQRNKALVVYTNKNLDLALLYVPKLKITNIPIHLLNKSAELGSNVFTLGYPSDQLVYNEGYISAMNGYDNDSAFYQITLPLNPGNSGGPLFDNSGSLIGIVMSKNTSMEGVAFALKSTMIYNIKDSLPADSIKQIWTKAFKKFPSKKENKSSTIQKMKTFIFKVYVYQKSV
jgi:serine protease Do